MIIEEILKAAHNPYSYSDAEWDQIENDAVNYSKRKRIDEYRKELSSVNPEIEIVGDHFLSGRRIKCKCKKCGYEWNANVSNLLRGSQCRNCLGLLCKTSEQFIEEARQANDRVEVLGKYINDSTPITCKCVFCGHVWDSRPRNILKGNACPKCKGKRISETKRKTTEQFKEELLSISPNIEVIGEYTGANNHIMCKCRECGKTWEPQASNLMQGKRCPYCKGKRSSVKQRKTTAQFIEEMSIVAPNVEVIGEYINCHTNIRYCCKTCGYEWEQAPSNFFRMTRHNCRNCHTPYKRIQEI